MFKEEFVGGIPRTEALISAGWITREFEFALRHSQRLVPSRKRIFSA